MRKKNLMVFDIDGTLTDSINLHQKAFIEMLEEVGVAKINSEFKTFEHHTDTFISKTIYEKENNIPFSERKIIEFENGLNQKIIREKIVEIKGAKELIETLENETDFGVCFATGSLRRPAEFKLMSIGILFDENQLVASDEFHEREIIVAKAIEKASEYYKVNDFERIVSVGDGLWDLITAKNLGLEFIGIGLKNKNMLLENGAETIYENLIEFELPKERNCSNSY